MSDYEKLGLFYLGKSYDLAQGKRGEDLILYDAKDLTTHAMIIGMTGSGKTGLGIAMIEEAAIDRIPVIAVDPKGDLTNVLLTFPDLGPQDFRPWVSAEEAAARGISLDTLAEHTAGVWRKGLEEWGQSGERIRRLRETVDMTIYTPGSTAGAPISVLRSFAPPPPQLRDDSELYREHIQATASSVLGLLGIDADPLTSREHVLIATILHHAWDQGQALDIAGLIRAITEPPFRSIGVMDVESFFPSKERFALGMRLNTLLAAPGFDAWLQGEPLDTGRFLYTDAGKPRIAVISIAHLGDRERMFFVSMLLGDMMSWMRAQPGTGSLRALFYMDELFGYMPPLANPPSKTLLLTLLKQARAFGLGLVLSTQNPVDLDYKGLSNIGTWFIGRLQTERDKLRVMDGLEGAAGGGPFDRQAMDRILAGLGKRIFLMRNVHEDEPVVFTTRWVMSYLAGPLTRDQIKTLMAAHPVKSPAPATPAVAATRAINTVPAGGPPVLPAEIPQYWIPARPGVTSPIYLPHAIGAADVTFVNARFDVQVARRVVSIAPISDGPVTVEWGEARELTMDVASLQRAGLADATYTDLPEAARRQKSYDEWARAFARWLRSSQELRLYQSLTLKDVSRPGETERDFRIRLQQRAREQRDDRVEALRRKYAPRLGSLRDRLARAEASLKREQAQQQQQQWGTAASVGSTLLGALMGRRMRGGGNIGSSIGRMQREAADVQRAEASVASIEAQIAELEAELQSEIARIETSFDALTEPLDTVTVAPRQNDVSVRFVGLAWAPHARDAHGNLVPAW
ncbi:MAG: ATP-binding protein [Chloroflexi bacterium]|nr:ATP-binding protein [Chloroflexota bacterium]